MSTQGQSVSRFFKPSRRSSHGLLGALLLIVCYFGSIGVLVRLQPQEPTVFEQIA